MNINTLIESFKTAISTSADLNQWCVATYDRAPKVYINIDNRNPPGEEECPFCVIHPVSKRVGFGVSTKRHSFEVDCCIYDESTRTTGQVVEYNSVRRIEEFRKLVENAIAAIDIDPALLEEIDIEYEFIESFPFAWAGMTIGLSEDFILGTDSLK